MGSRVSLPFNSRSFQSCDAPTTWLCYRFTVRCRAKMPGRPCSRSADFSIIETRKVASVTIIHQEIVGLSICSEFIPH